MPRWIALLRDPEMTPRGAPACHPSGVVRILIVEDDSRMADVVRRGFQAEGVAVDVAQSGEEALWRAQAATYGVIALDLMLPGIDGIETCRRLRAAEVWTPILMLTARDAVRDRVDGLDSGADDYLIKPFSFEELLARVRALARREPGPRATVLAVGDLRLDPATHGVWRGSEEIALSSREVAILEAFMRRPGEVLSRYDLLESVWSGEFDHRSNVVDVAVRRLRDKIDRPFGTASIETVRGAGYRLCEPAGR
jgi:two-component system OmpR family response regulator